MINILTSTLEINNNKAYEDLKEYINPNSKILVMPYANFPYLMKDNNFDELFNYNYGREFLDIVEQFKPYGVRKEDIWVINPKDTVEFVLDKMKRADIVLLTGGNPDYIAEYMPQEVFEEMDNMNIVIGISAGSMYMCSVYYMYKGYSDDCVPLIKKDNYPFGLTYVFDNILVHYDEEDEIQRKAIARHSGRYYSPLILLKDGEYLVYKDYQLIKEG